jgi:hypothetical protein
LAVARHSDKAPIIQHWSVAGDWDEHEPDTKTLLFRKKSIEYRPKLRAVEVVPVA